MTQPKVIQTDYRLRTGKRLRLVREQTGETQTQFANRLGVSGLSMHKYETGVTCPTAEQLHQLEQTGIDAAYVAFGRLSLGDAQARKKFAAVFSWLKGSLQSSLPDVADELLIDLTWSMFCKLNDEQGQTPPTAEQMNAEAQAVLATLMSTRNNLKK
jgi:transcriptional regulator with XRE-family HTH domain